MRGTLLKARGFKQLSQLLDSIQVNESQSLAQLMFRKFMVRRISCFKFSKLKRNQGIVKRNAHLQLFFPKQIISSDPQLEISAKICKTQAPLKIVPTDTVHNPHGYEIVWWQMTDKTVILAILKTFFYITKTLQTMKRRMDKNSSAKTQLQRIPVTGSNNSYPTRCCTWRTPGRMIHGNNLQEEASGTGINSGLLGILRMTLLRCLQSNFRYLL